MPIPLIPAAIAATGLLQTGASIWSNRASQNANMRLAKYQYSKDLEMWNRNNEYNTPAAQMQRLEDAGLNPNIVYGSGTVSGNTSGSMPHYQAPRIQYETPVPDIPQMIGMYQDIRKSNAEIDLIKAQTKATYNTSMNKELEGILLGLDTTKASYEREALLQNEETFIDSLVSGWKTKMDIQKNAKAVAQLNESRLTTEQLRQQYQKYENQFKAMGITSSDHPAFRIIAAIFNELGINPLSMFSELKTAYKREYK